MLKVLLASIRVAIALSCGVVLVLVIGQWTGVLPATSHMSADFRRQQQDKIGLTAGILIRDNRWPELESVLSALITQDRELTAIHLQSGTRHVSVGNHGTVGVQGRQSTTQGGPPPHRTTRQLAGAAAGKIDFFYRTPLPSGSGLTPRIGSMTCFVGAAIGLLVLALMRMLRVMRPTQLVPDRIRRALDTLSEGLLIMDERERILLANQAFGEMIGVSQDALVGRRTSDLPWVCSAVSSTGDLPWIRAIDQEAAQTEQLMRYRIADDDCRFFSINASPIASGESKGRGALATFRDVTTVETHRAELEHMLVVLRNSRDEISSKNRELEILAAQDALTGCLNRRALYDQFEDAWVSARRDLTPLSCLMIDNDHFKLVNDTYGHHVGDEVLKRVAETIRDVFPEPAMVCRYGGEEFCVVLPGQTLEGAVEAGDEVRRAIEAIEMEPSELSLSVSVGVSSLRFKASEPQELINQADQCLYVAKRQGRNRVIPFSEEVAATSIEEGEEEMGRGELPSHDATGLPFHAVTALVSALAYRDSETAEHSRRVADLCVRSAAGLLDQRSIYILEIAALLHDIGKIGVPDNVLLKPERLTPDEWKLMKRHDRIGVELVAGTFNHPDLNEIIRARHAFFSGRDSDRHLPVGDDIPIGSRLLNIADSYDAMVSDHVYRKGCSHDDAIEELRRCAGSQFDPLLVEHFATVLEDQVEFQTEAALAIPKPTAMQIGLQIERLADALDARDVDGLQTLAARLGAMARHHRIESIAVAADRIEAASIEEDDQWITLLRDTQLLMNLCRATQNAFLGGPDLPSFADTQVLNSADEKTRYEGATDDDA